MWAIPLRDALPVVPIPLSEGDVDLDLMLALGNVYDALGYDLEIDYRSSPEIPISESDERWADDLLRARGLRP